MTTEWKPAMTDRQRKRHRHFLILVAEAKDQGMDLGDISQATGMSYQTIKTWNMEEPTRIPTEKFLTKLETLVRGKR